MNHPIHKVVEFKIEAPYVLRVRFEDGTSHRINFQPVLAGELYSPLQDLTLFNQVSLDPEVPLLCGQTVRTSIQQHCMIGPRMRKRYAREQNAGKWSKPEKTISGQARHPSEPFAHVQIARQDLNRGSEKSCKL